MKQLRKMSSPALISCLFFLAVSRPVHMLAQKVSNDDLKVNQAPIENALTKLAELKPITYTFDATRYKGIDLPAGRQMGFNADEVKALMPEVVSPGHRMHILGKNSRSYLSANEVQLVGLVPLLLAAIQEQQKEIETLKRDLRKK